MKKLLLLPLLLICFVACQPDLVVSEFTVGTLTAHGAASEAYYTAPSTIAVRNIGDSRCSRFMVGLDDDGSTAWVFFESPEVTKGVAWYCDGLDEGEEKEWVGTIEIDPTVSITSLTLYVEADIGDPVEGQPTVDEKDETNNRSAPVNITLPRNP